jgi:hypothetical protein
MQDLRLENRILIVSQIKQYCTKLSLDYIDILETMYDTIANEGEESTHLDVIVETLKDKLKKETLYDTEEELFHVISIELDDIMTQEVLDNSNPDDVADVFKFLEDEYFEIFKQYFEKKGYISDDDYDECVLTVFNNYELDEFVAETLVGKFLMDNIISK